MLLRSKTLIEDKEVRKKKERQKRRSKSKEKMKREMMIGWGRR